MAKDAETAALRGIEPMTKVRSRHNPKESDWVKPLIQVKARKLREKDEEDAEQLIRDYIDR